MPRSQPRKRAAIADVAGRFRIGKARGNAEPGGKKYPNTNNINDSATTWGEKSRLERMREMRRGEGGAPRRPRLPSAGTVARQDPALRDFDECVREKEHEVLFALERRGRLYRGPRQ